MPLNSYKNAEENFIKKIGKGIFLIIEKISLFFSNIVEIGRQRFTVMLIPHSEKKIFNFRISVFSLIVVAFLIVCMLTSFVIFTTQFKGMSALLDEKTANLEGKEIDLELLRDQIADLKNVSKVFEASLAKTLGTFGIDNPISAATPLQSSGDFVASLAAVGAEDNTLVKEFEYLKNLSDLLNKSVSSFEEIKELLVKQGELLVDLPTLWPLKNIKGIITAKFGPAVHPFTKQWYLHKGIDLAYAYGTPVAVTANGKVIERGYQPTEFGNYVLIRHKYGFFTKYAHMDKVYVNEGETVTQGQIIGTMGNTGLSTAPHLHYEVRIGSQVVDPERYLNMKNKSYENSTFNNGRNLNE